MEEDSENDNKQVHNFDANQFEFQGSQSSFQSKFIKKSFYFFLFLKQEDENLFENEIKETFPSQENQQQNRYSNYRRGNQPFRGRRGSFHNQNNFHKRKAQTNDEELQNQSFQKHPKMKKFKKEFHKSQMTGEKLYKLSFLEDPWAELLQRKNLTLKPNQDVLATTIQNKTTENIDPNEIELEE